MAVIGLAALSAVLTVVAAHRTCTDGGVETAPGGVARGEVPANYLRCTDRRAAYDPEDAIPSAANCVRILLARADGNLRAAILAHNHPPAYVSAVLARARAYGRETDVALAGVAGDLALTAPRWWSIVASSCSRWTSTGRASHTAERGEEGLETRRI
jgi:hypothetical protein